MDEFELTIKAIKEAKAFCKVRNLNYDCMSDEFVLIASAYYEYFKKNQKV